MSGSNDSGTTQSRRQLHLGANVLSNGAHPAAWQADESDPSASVSLDYWSRIAAIAEAGRLDAVFIADTLSLHSGEMGPATVLDPLVLVSALAARTEHVGFVPTISTSFEEPFNLARRLATLDHLSGGRAGWNVVTSADPRSASNFGSREHAAKVDRYARAQEFLEVSDRLWDSWQDGAVVGDKQDGVWADSQRIQPIDHRGAHFTVAGPSTLPRSPQGRPVLVQAGGSPAGLDLAARWADLVFGWHPVLAGSVAYRADLRARAARLGRDPDSLLLMPGLAFTLGGTEAEANARRDALDELAGPRVLAILAGTVGADPGELELDEPLPDALLHPSNSEASGSRGMSGIPLELARSERLTVRELMRRIMFHRNVVGTPEQLADTIAEWFDAGAADGFNLMPDVGVSGLQEFVTEVVPLLQRRGIFRTDYEGTTFREHLGHPARLHESAV